MIEYTRKIFKVSNLQKLNIYYFTFLIRKQIKNCLLKLIVEFRITELYLYFDFLVK